MQKHPIDAMMQTTMEQIRSMVDVNTVVGTPVSGTRDTTIIPISRVSFGFIAGGGEYAVEDHRRNTVMPETFPFAGGTGAGVSVQPVGFLVVGDGTVKVLPAQSGSAMERIVELLPQLVEEYAQNGEKSGKTRNKKVYKTEIETIDFDDGGDEA